MISITFFWFSALAALGVGWARSRRLAALRFASGAPVREDRKPGAATPTHRYETREAA